MCPQSGCVWPCPVPPRPPGCTCSWTSKYPLLCNCRLQRSRLLEKRERQKQRMTGGVFLPNNPPRDDPTRPLVNRPFGSAGRRSREGGTGSNSGLSSSDRLYGYDGPMAFSGADPDDLDPPSNGLVNFGSSAGSTRSGNMMMMSSTPAQQITTVKEAPATLIDTTQTRGTARSN